MPRQGRHSPCRVSLRYEAALLAVSFLLAVTSASKPTARHCSGKIWGMSKPILSPSCLALPRGGSEVPARQDAEAKEEEGDVEEAKEEQQEEEEEEGDKGKKDITSMAPIVLLVKTNVNNKLLDQSVEMMAVRTRNVESLRKALARQLPGKPPLETIRLMQHGQVLRDELLVDELMEDEDEGDDDDGDDSADKNKPSLILTLDMVPPVDPRFANPLEETMAEMSTADLLDAYTLNEAAIWFSSQSMIPTALGEGQESTATPSPTLISFQLRQYANMLKSRLEETVFTEKAAPLLDDPIPPARAALEESQKIQVRGRRIRAPATPGGTSSSVVGLKQTVQHYLNINWGDTIRNFCLFLFFGWFGGRSITSRAVLLLGAPLCFIVQARPVKLWGKELFYLLLNNPPSILLSLLPAPQQAMLSLSDEEALRLVYGEDAPIVAREDEDRDDAEDDDDDDDDEADNDGDEDDSDDED